MNRIGVVIWLLNEQGKNDVESETAVMETGEVGSPATIKPVGSLGTHVSGDRHARRFAAHPPADGDFEDDANAGRRDAKRPIPPRPALLATLHERSWPTEEHRLEVF